MPETNINISDKIQKITKTTEEYKNSLVESLKDVEVNIKNWNFNVGKVENEYNVELNIKLGIKSKPKSA